MKLPVHVFTDNFVIILAGSREPALPHREKKLAIFFQIIKYSKKWNAYAVLGV